MLRISSFSVGSGFIKLYLEANICAKTLEIEQMLVDGISRAPDPVISRDNSELCGPVTSKPS